MGRGWVNAIRVSEGARKGKLFTKIAKEIAVAVRTGGGASPENNPRLRSALRDAQKASMPKDTVERAIKRGSGASQEADLVESTYEGYGPHGVAVMIETLSDNKNRTVQDLRALFVRAGGNMGESGSVQWMFDHVASVVAKSNKAGADAEEAAINAGADNVEDLEEGGQWMFTGAISDLENIQKGLEAQGWDVLKAELIWKAKTPTELSPDQEKDLKDFLERLDDNDDVKKVHLSV